MRAWRLLPSTEALHATGRWCLRTFFACAFVLGVLGSIQVRDSVQSDDRFFLESWRLELGDLPAWVTPDIRAELEGLRLVGMGERLSLFSPGVLGRITQGLERVQWIKAVADVSVKYPTFEKPGVLGLELHLRRPVALFEQGGLFYLADAEGMRLGAPYIEAPTEWFQVPVITGVALPGVLPEPGARWASRDALQGIEVAKVLMENGIQHDFPGSPIQAIDLTNLHGRVSSQDSEIVLLSSRQRLAWGRSPISSSARTATVPQLVANLRYVLSNPQAFSHLALIHLHRKPEALTGVRG